MSDSRPYRAGQDEQLDPWTVASYGESSGDSTIAVVVKPWSALRHVGTARDYSGGGSGGGGGKRAIVFPLGLDLLSRSRNVVPRSYLGVASLYPTRSLPIRRRLGSNQ